MTPTATLRAYAAADEAAAIELWRRTWQEAYPAIDFSTRLDWWRERWRNEIVPDAAIVIIPALAEKRMQRTRRPENCRWPGPTDQPTDDRRGAGPLCAHRST